MAQLGRVSSRMFSVLSLAGRAAGRPFVVARAVRQQLRTRVSPAGTGLPWKRCAGFHTTSAAYGTHQGIIAASKELWTMVSQSLDSRHQQRWRGKQQAARHGLPPSWKALSPRPADYAPRRAARSVHSAATSGGSRTGGAGAAPPEKNESVVPETTTSTVKMAFVGNMLITVMKFAMWFKTGSSAMFSEAMHTLVDCGNQAFLLLGLRQASMKADTVHQYGYGRAAFFWSLVSALGMFWMGACVSWFHGLSHLISPTVDNHAVGWETWAVLGFSFAVDGVVFVKAFRELAARASEAKQPMLRYLFTMNDPFLLAVLLEDFSGTVGVLLAAGGIGLTQVTANPMWDGLASLAIGSLLGGVAFSLVRTNQRFLLGQSVDPNITSDIKSIILSRDTVDKVVEVQSQWLGPGSFAFKAEVDFDGSNIAAQLHERYESEFIDAEDLEKDLPVLLACFAEDVTRLVEREVKTIETLIQRKHPQAVFIELEPDSYHAYRRKIDDMGDRTLKKYEHNIMLRQLNALLEKRVLQSKLAGVDTSAEAKAWFEGTSATPVVDMRPETFVQVIRLMKRRYRHKELRRVTQAVRQQALSADHNEDSVVTRSTRAGRYSASRGSSASGGVLAHPLMSNGNGGRTGSGAATSGSDSMTQAAADANVDPARDLDDIDHASPLETESGLDLSDPPQPKPGRK